LAADADADDVDVLEVLTPSLHCVMLSSCLMKRRPENSAKN